MVIPPPPPQLPKLSWPAPSVSTQSPFVPLFAGKTIVLLAPLAADLSVVVKPLPAWKTIEPCVLALPTVTLVFASKVSARPLPFIRKFAD